MAPMVPLAGAIVEKVTVWEALATLKLWVTWGAAV